MSDLIKLRQEHAQLVKIVGRLKEAIEADVPPAAVELFEVRRELTSTLIAHLKAEDWALYPRLLESSDPAVVETAKRFNAEMGGLAATFSVYAQRWTAMSIQENWTGFRHETREIIDALTCRITRENRELYPLLDRLDRAA